MKSKRDYQSLGFQDGTAAAKGEEVIRVFAPGATSWQAQAYNEGWETAQASAKPQTSPTGRIVDDAAVVLNNALDQQQAVLRPARSTQEAVLTTFHTRAPGKSVAGLLAALSQYPSEPPASWPHGAREHYRVLLKLMKLCTEPRRFARLQQAIHRLQARHGS